MNADRIKAPLVNFIRQVMSKVDYFALYEAKVVSQSGSKLDCQPTDTRLPSMSDVPIRNGLPGTTVSFAPGQTILLGWDGGDPRKPYVALYSGGETVLELKLTGTSIKVEGTTVTLSNGVLAVARMTDMVTGTAGPFPLSGALIAGGNPNVKA